jgi:hypothetical protein
VVVGIAARERCRVLEGCPCCRLGLIAWMQTTGWEVERALESSCWSIFGGFVILNASRVHAQIEFWASKTGSSRYLNSPVADRSNRTLHNAGEEQSRSRGCDFQDGRHASTRIQREDNATGFIGLENQFRECDGM